MSERTAERFSRALFWTTVVLGVGFMIAVAFGTAVTFGGGNRSDPITGLAFALVGVVGAVGVSLLGGLMVRRASTENVLGSAGYRPDVLRVVRALMLVIVIEHLEQPQAHLFVREPVDNLPPCIHARNASRPGRRIGPQSHVSRGCCARKWEAWQECVA